MHIINYNIYNIVVLFYIICIYISLEICTQRPVRPQSRARVVEKREICGAVVFRVTFPGTK